MKGTVKILIKKNQELFIECRKLKWKIEKYELLTSQKNFPIQKTYGVGGNEPQTVIPWWLAEEAYSYYASRFGRGQSLERLAERGGFARKELLGLLRRDLLNA